MQAQELQRVQGRQEELLQRLQEAQEREAASASQIQALSSQLEEARDARREVGDGSGRGQWALSLRIRRKPAEPGSRCWEHHMPLCPACGWWRLSEGTVWGRVSGSPLGLAEPGHLCQAGAEGFGRQGQHWPDCTPDSWKARWLP